MQKKSLLVFITNRELYNICINFVIYYFLYRIYNISIEDGFIGYLDVVFTYSLIVYIFVKVSFALHVTGVGPLFR